MMVQQDRQRQWLAGKQEAKRALEELGAEYLTLSQLQTLPDEELVRIYDLFVKSSEVWRLGPNDYRDELNRRRSDRYTKTLLVLTWVLVVLTVVLVFLTFALLRSGS